MRLCVYVKEKGNLLVSEFVSVLWVSRTGPPAFPKAASITSCGSCSFFAIGDDGVSFYVD